MAKVKKEKPAKKRADTYDPKLSIKGSFADVIGVSVGKTPEPPKPATPTKKKSQKKEE